MSSTIRHIGVVVSDFDKALKFWCGTMGFVIERQMEETGPHLDAMMGLNDVRVTTAKLADSNGNLLELLWFTSHPDKKQWLGEPYSTGLTHIALTVSDLNEAYDRLRDKDVAFFAPPQRSPDGRVNVTYARGPEGVILELVEEL
jgi:catechol 2,3-dioxygenase-like lactoylglutathione lyase family enzyme